MESFWNVEKNWMSPSHLHDKYHMYYYAIFFILIIGTLISIIYFNNRSKKDQQHEIDDHKIVFGIAIGAIILLNIIGITLVWYDYKLYNKH